MSFLYWVSFFCFIYAGYWFTLLGTLYIAKLANKCKLIKIKCPGISYLSFSFDSYTIFDLKSEDNYLIYITLSACFEASGPCMFSTTIFNGFRLPQLSCTSGTDRLDDTCKYNSRI